MAAPRRAGVCLWAGICPPTPLPQSAIWGGNFKGIHSSTLVVLLFDSASPFFSYKSDRNLHFSTARVDHSESVGSNFFFFFFLVSTSQPEKVEHNMPRSFLVKKYFSNKKPYYRESQLESQAGKFLLCFGVCYLENNLLLTTRGSHIVIIASSTHL